MKIINLNTVDIHQQQTKQHSLQIKMVDFALELVCLAWNSQLLIGKYSASMFDAALLPWPSTESIPIDLYMWRAQCRDTSDTIPHYSTVASSSWSRARWWGDGRGLPLSLQAICDWIYPPKWKLIPRSVPFPHNRALCTCVSIFYLHPHRNALQWERKINQHLSLIRRHGW